MFFKKKIRTKKRETFLEDHETLYMILVGMFFAFAGLLISDLLYPQEFTVLSSDYKWVTLFSHRTSIFFKILFSLSFFLLGVFSSAYFIEHYTRKGKIDKITGTLISIQTRLNNMGEHVAFHTEDGVIERNVMDVLHKKEDGVMWIVARFVSKQLSKSFSMLKFETDGDEYSNFSEKLYQECTKSIYLTSPFTPAEWFRQLYPDKADNVLEMIDRGESLDSYVRVPAHVHALVNATAESKKRLVIIASAIMPSLIAQEKLLRKFLSMHPGIDTRFVEKEALCEKYHFACNGEFDFAKYDFAIFDREILLKWERPLKAKQKCPLSLMDLANIQDSDIKEICKQIVDEIFEFNTGQHMTGGEILKNISDKKEKLKKIVTELKDLPHKYAYYTTGAISWDTVSKDVDYDLGRREWRALSEFLQQPSMQSSLKDNSQWNILHIGPGNGKEIPAIVSSAGIQWIRNYVLIDISPELLQLSTSYGRRNFANVNFLPYVQDVTEHDINLISEKQRESGAARNLIVIVGNGAILSNGFVLKSIKRSMKHDDKLIITLERYDESRKGEIIEQYKLPSIIELLKQPLSLIGIEGNDIEKFFEFKYNDTPSLVEVWFCFRDWIAQQEEQKNNFQSFPDSFRIFASLRPTANKLEELLIAEGFDVEKKDFSEESCCGFICKVT